MTSLIRIRAQSLASAVIALAGILLVALLAAAVSGGVSGSESDARDRHSGRGLALDRVDLGIPDSGDDTAEPAPAGCTDQDGDGFCDTEDCDDTNPHCALDCTDGDGDGYCDDQDNCPGIWNPNQGSPIQLNRQVGFINIAEYDVSSDSSTVVFLGDQDSDNIHELFSVPILGGVDPVKLSPPLTSNADVADFAISPDGSTVVHRAEKFVPPLYLSFVLYSTPIGGGTPVEISGPFHTFSNVLEYEISPDSATVVYRGDLEFDWRIELYAVPIGGGEVTNLSSLPVDQDVAQFAITPDGSTVVYGAEEPGGIRDLYSVPLSGGASTNLYTAPLGSFGVSAFGVTPDSTRVVYIADSTVSGQQELFSVPIGGGASTKLDGTDSSSEDTFDFSISPDGSTVVYNSDEETNNVAEIFSVPVGGGPSTKLNGPLVWSGDVAEHLITPDSAHVIYRADQNTDNIFELFSVPIGGGAATMLNDPIGIDKDVENFTVTPDGSTVVFLSDALFVNVDKLYSVPVGGGQNVLLTPDQDLSPELDTFLVTPDGSNVIYRGRVPDPTPVLFSVPVDGGPITRLSGPSVGDGEVFDFVVSPDSSSVVYRAPQDSPTEWEIYRVPPSTGVDKDADGYGEPCDCDDLLWGCTTDCTDIDDDGFCVTHDCDESNAFCGMDCTDDDGDGWCPPQDCDDQVATCQADCADNDMDGLAMCAGDCDDSKPNCTTDCTDTDLDGYCVTHDCDDSLPNCSVDCTDDDGDEWCPPYDCDDQIATCQANCIDADGDGFAPCAGDCNDSNPDCTLDCTDGDGDGVCVGHDCDDTDPQCSYSCDDPDNDGYCDDLDCNDTDPECSVDCTDADSDGFCAEIDCLDTNSRCTTECTDADFDGWCVTHDCDDNNALCQEDCTDGDTDGFCASNDCNDADPVCSVNCSDPDGDGWCGDIDCAVTNPMCNLDCTDGDADGWCVNHDCNDAAPTCTTDCTDADGDGLAMCQGDCDDFNPNCTLDCTDGDEDGFCVLEDCDDTDSFCAADCSDADGDGLRACNGDCNDLNANCTTDCTDADADGFCVTTDCDETNEWCNASCSDVDGDGICPPQDCDDGDINCAFDCTDDDGDGLRACNGDCDDDNANARPGLSEVCTDNADNDCNGLTDIEESVCSDLLTGDLTVSQNSPTTLSWAPAPNADAYALYRGRISRTGFAGYNHLCEATLLGGTTAIDPDTPRRGEAYYYLATGVTVQAEFTGGPLGVDSNSLSRPDSDAITCGPRVFVDPDNLAGPNDGLSWATAYTSLSDAVKHGSYDNRGSEIWIRSGQIDGGAFASVAHRTGARLLGGFDGTENETWERPAAGLPTVVDSGGFGSGLWVSGMSVALERMTLQNAGSGVLAEPSGILLELNGITTQQISGYGVDLGADSPVLPRLNIEDGTFDATSGLGGIRAVSEGGTLSGLIRGNTIIGGSDAGMRLEAQAQPLGDDATVALDVIGNTITGGAVGMVLGSQMGEGPEDLVATQESFVASNLIHGTMGHAVVVEAVGTDLEPQDSVVSRPLIVGNTISDGGGAGVLASASRSGPDGDVRSEPQLWDNLITFHSGPGVEETADDEPNGVVAEPLLVGNDLFGNLALYRDEGATDLTLIDDVNLLTGAYDNYDEDPGYRDRPADDYHLSIGTVLGIGSPMVYLDNQSDPGIGMGWTGSFDDSGWDPGFYGIGYDTGPLPNAQNLILTAVPAGTLSIYTRVTFDIDEVGDVIALTFGSDHDDGVVAWINGVEIFRSASMPAGPLLWNSSPTEHESSNGDTPVYEEHDVSTLGIPALQTGPNVLAVGVWNTDPGSDDLVLVPRLIVNQDFPPIDAGHLEAPRLSTEDIDGGPRILDGLRDFLGRPDTGADER